METIMFRDILRKFAMAALVGFIVGGLWVLASWKAEVENPGPTIFSAPVFQPAIRSNPLLDLSSDSRSDGPSFDQVLFEDDQIIGVS
jgi:hypothetical protein